MVVLKLKKIIKLKKLILYKTDQFILMQQHHTEEGAQKNKTMNQELHSHLKLKEHKTPFDSFIGAYYIDKKICDDVVKFFKNNFFNFQRYFF